ncbi:MAG: diguanylate phosphodiesterase, partial [Pseudomonas fluorescens]
MSNVTPPSSVSALNPATGSPLRGSLKGALAALVLLLLALLFWQLLDQLRDAQQHQRQYTIDYTADLASQVSLNMALNAQIALNLLPIVEQPQSADEQQALFRKLQKSLPELRSLALLSPSGKVLGDSAADSNDADYLSELIRRSHAQAHYFSNANDGSVVHLLLHQASGSTRGYWVLRLTPTFFSSLTKQNETGIRPLWVVENRVNHQIISRDDGQLSATPAVMTPDELAN